LSKDFPKQFKLTYELVVKTSGLTAYLTA